MLTHPTPKQTNEPKESPSSAEANGARHSAAPAPLDWRHVIGNEWGRLRKRDSHALMRAGAVVLALAMIVVLVVGLHGGTASAPASVKQITVPAHQTYNAQPQAAPSGDVANITLTAEEKLLSIAPGVAYHAWTFNGTAPGPILRVRQGQTVNFTLINHGMMGHSIDFHAAQVPPNIDYRPIPAGGSLSFSFTPNYPGVFMYHCGASPVMDHIANGMYGAIIVDPATGWTPAQEYVLVQSEFYTQKNADGSYSLNEQKMMAMQPDYVVFNGYADQYVSAPLTAQPNQKIRLFIVDAGPSGFSAFHVIGAIFSDYYPDGNPANHLQGDQTITIPPGGGAVVELTIPEAGSYNFVTHSFAAAMSGAIGTIKVG